MNAVARGKRDMFEAFVNKELGEGNLSCCHYAQNPNVIFIELESLLKGCIPDSDVHEDDKPSQTTSKHLTKKKTLPKHVSTILPSDPDSTILPSDPDSTVLPSGPNTTIPPSDPHTTIPPSDPDTSMLPSDPDTTMLPSDPDISTLSLNGEGLSNAPSSNILDGKTCDILVECWGV
jgi:hypothetical protein